MQVRRFEATTMKDALTAVKRELGTNAVILGTKEVYGPENVKLYEVTAAAAVQAKAGASSENSAETASTNPGYEMELANRLSELNEIMPTRSQMRLIEGAIHDVKTMLVESMRTQAMQAGNADYLFAVQQTLKNSGVDPFVIADLTKHLHTLPPPAEIAKPQTMPSKLTTATKQFGG